MKRVSIDEGWTLADGLYNIYDAINPAADQGKRLVNLPHDYMIEGDVDPKAVEKTASGFYTVDLKHYNKKVQIPKEWEGENIYLDFDGAMMNYTVEVNGAKAGLQHYGYSPIAMDITRYLYPGEENRITITPHAGTQPNSRWYSGAGIYRSLHLSHGPKLHIAADGIYAYTKEIEYDRDGKAIAATVKVEVELVNNTDADRTVVVEAALIPDHGHGSVYDKAKALLVRRGKLQVNANSTGTAYLTMTLEDPLLWNIDTPNLYQLAVTMTEAGEFKTHEVAAVNPMVDQASVLFGIRTVTADVRHGLRVNGRTVKLKGGCLHHDNGIIGSVSLYDVEYRKLAHMKAIGFNAIRTTHNPPSAALIEAANRIGMYVFDEAFDAWDIPKQIGDYSQFFATDWKRDLGAFLKRDRSAACVIIWSTGNELPERAGMDRGYTRATELAEFIKGMDASRPVSNGLCSFWSGQDDQLMKKTLMDIAERMKNGEEANIQNAKGSKGTDWEEGTWAFTNGLDIVGYNYLEPLYEQDHEMYPERVILGSENYPKEIGIHWPKIEEKDYLLGDFTWTAYDYIGEAAIGQARYLDPEDPILKMGPDATSSHTAGFPNRTANDADFDINGELLPQGAYRSVVWGSNKTWLYSFDPAVYGKVELLSAWGFPAVYKNWNWQVEAGTMTELMIFTGAEEVEIRINGRYAARKAVDGKGKSCELPKAVIIPVPFEAGVVEAVSYTNGIEVSRDSIESTGAPATIRLTVDESVPVLKADGHSVAYVMAEIVDAEGRVVPCNDILLQAKAEGAGYLAGFGSGASATTENYAKGSFTTYHGKVMAVLRSGYETGKLTFTVEAKGFEPAVVTFEI